MKTNNTRANLKGMAKHTYNRVMSAMAEDSDSAMLHTFAALTDGAKAIALQSGNFSNLYIRGIYKDMTAEEAANGTANAKTLTASILDELNARKCRGTWDNAVNAYAVELVESLDNWNKQPESVAELREMILNGAADWTAYSWGGSSLIYNWDIAERLCTPSELRRLTRKDGTLNDSPRGVHLLDIQARALFQAANRVARIAAKHFYA